MNPPKIIKENKTKNISPHFVRHPLLPVTDNKRGKVIKEIIIDLPIKKESKQTLITFQSIKDRDVDSIRDIPAFEPGEICGKIIPTFDAG